MARSQPRTRAVAWSKQDPPGAEFALVELDHDRLRATGIAIGSAPEPYRLEYTLVTEAGFVTTRVSVRTVANGWNRRLELLRGGGGWSATVAEHGAVALPPPGGDTAQLGAALDADLGLSPMFNTMPVLRHNLHEVAGQRDLLMVWISVPDLAIHRSRQRYMHLARRSAEERAVRFESLDAGSRFSAEVVFEGDGLVLDYPGIAQRI
jgi:hypothetical protein